MFQNNSGNQPKPRAREKRFKFAKTSESELQKLVLSWLTVAGYYHKRVPVSAIPLASADGSFRFKKSPMKGFPDILFVFKNQKGRMGVIELKSTYGKLSEDQIRERALLEKAGVLYILAKDLNHIIETLKREDVSL